MVKKTTKKPSKNGIKQKQKQKQKQTVIVNINNGKTPSKRQPTKPREIKRPQYINTYPVFVQNEPSPPIIYQSPPVINQTPIKSPVKIANEVGTQSLTNTNEIGTQSLTNTNEIGTQSVNNTNEIGTQSLRNTRHKGTQFVNETREIGTQAFIPQTVYI